MELSPNEIVRVRLEEAQASARRLDATYLCAGEKDGLISYQASTIQKAVEIVRQSQAFLVFTHSPQDYMIDHEITAQLVRNACFCAGIPNFGTNAHPPAPILPGVPYLYYSMPVEGKDSLGRTMEMEFYVDVTEHMEQKAELLACHASQRDWLMKHHKVDEYIEQMKRWSALAGSRSGVAFAEGFLQHRGHAYPQDNRLVEILKDCEM